MDDDDRALAEMLDRAAGWEPDTIIVCQGPPRCDLTGDEAVAEQTAGCIWCRRINVWPDGTETDVEPGRA